MANLKPVRAKFVEALPEPILPTSNSPYDLLRADLIANSGAWAFMGTFKDLTSGGASASAVRGSRDRWAGHTWAAQVSDGYVRDENGDPILDAAGNPSVVTDGKVDVYIKHVAVGEPPKDPNAPRRGRKSNAQKAAEAAALAEANGSAEPSAETAETADETAVDENDPFAVDETEPATV